MNELEIEQIIKQIVSSNTGMKIEEIDLFSNMMSDMDISSMEILLIIADIEEKLSVVIGEKDIRSFSCLKDIIEYVMKHDHSGEREL